MWGKAQSQSRGGVLLTVLRDEGDAAVHDDGDVVSAHLLVSQRVPFTAGRSLDIQVPQREICSTDALQVQSPARSTKHTSVKRDPHSIVKAGTEERSPALFYQDQDVFLLMVPVL